MGDAEPASSVAAPNSGRLTQRCRRRDLLAPRRRRRVAGVALALERFLELAGDFVGRGVDRPLHDARSAGDRFVETFLYGRLADDDQPGLAGTELLRRIVELLAGQGSAPEGLGNHTHPRP